MNTPNPLVPQGSLHQQQSRGNSTVRIAVFAVVALHAVFFAGLLMQGCRPDTEKADGKLSSQSETDATNEIGTLDSKYYKTFNELPSVTTDFPVTNEPAPVSPETESPVPEITQPVEPIQPAPSNPQEEKSAPQTTEYVVVRGDSFYKIAKAHKVTLDAIVQANPNVDPKLIRPGQKIQVPAPVAVVVADAKVPAGSASGENVYVVKSGDTLVKIARVQNSSVAAIKSANNLRTDRILVGWKLVIPPASTSVSNAPAKAVGNQL